ncbi:MULTISPECIES: Flp pilus assembly protein CpaB [Pacificibacter]|uniref:Flp pilus assembly protein CpaB n=1 Tax=Pacificibacter TaxID=1042323 RepID=UPI001C09FE43|nr:MULTISPECIES: Flp pilus assembly protein CpaB [Pacificibacter]MBU2934884.1 Flp pilus assembly protein CpaB [Pacificibacter marinus]MDO6615859.1 Flp pilus assembly protein CpaB [Pacificibacter sp. 1_MG-2023]
MRIIFGLVLVVGMALAGFAVHITKGYLSTYQADLAREKALRQNIVKTEEIYIVTAKVAYGDPILPEAVTLAKWPVDFMPEGVFRTEDELFPQGADVPRIALRAIEPMEPLLGIKVTEPGADAGVAARLSKGMRAFAIRVDVSTGVSGFLRPGDKVDVYWTGNLPGQKNGEVTKLIESSVPLVAIDQMADGERSSPTIARTVTVEITPQQVAALAQAQSSGRLSLSLVGRDDDTVIGGVEIDQKTLLGIEAAAQIVAAPEERICTVRTRKGAEIIEMPIPCSQ